MVRKEVRLEKSESISGITGYKYVHKTTLENSVKCKQLENEENGAENKDPGWGDEQRQGMKMILSKWVRGGDTWEEKAEKKNMEQL